MRRPIKIAGALVGGVVLLLGGEAIYALTRDYPLAEPEQPISVELGDPARPELKFVVIGDSTSVGVGTTPDKSYAWRLSERLAAEYHVVLRVVGFGGATTDDVVDTQVDRALAEDPDLVLIEIGANDTTHLVPLRRVRSNIAETLDRLGAGDFQIVVAGPPGMGTSPVMPEPLRWLSGRRGLAVGRRIEAEARKRDLPFIDLREGTREKFLSDPEAHYSTDWFHPGAGGYELWADVMYPTVLEAARRAAG